MKCPVCPETALLMSERQGIEIDYCPNCRGVWLDRGELDKIIERTRPSAAAPAVYEYRDGHGRDHHEPGRRKSAFERLFDFD